MPKSSLLLLQCWTIVTLNFYLANPFNFRLTHFISSPFSAVYTAEASPLALPQHIKEYHINNFVLILHDLRKQATAVSEFACALRQRQREHKGEANRRCRTKGNAQIDSPRGKMTLFSVLAHYHNNAATQRSHFHPFERSTSSQHPLFTLCLLISNLLDQWRLKSLPWCLKLARLQHLQRWILLFSRFRGTYFDWWFILARIWSFQYTLHHYTWHRFGTQSW